MNKIWLLACLYICGLPGMHAHEYRNMLQKEVNSKQLRGYLAPGQQWVYYPDYSDREGWDSLTSGVRTTIIAQGEQYLEYQWQVVTATDYLEFGRSGNRKAMEAPFEANNTAFTSLVMAELAEGKGRFLDQIANGAWYYCEMTTWCLSAVVGLPSYREDIIDLTSGDVGAFMAWTYYFFREELESINPLIPARIRETVQKRIMDPYMQRDDFWWQAFGATPETMINNWNPWCNFNVLSCFLLLENDPDRLADAAYRTLTSVDRFLNYVEEDGACEEGPSYWAHAAGKLYDYLSVLYAATEGQVSIFGHPMIKRMGEYIVDSYVGDRWVVNFADASARGETDKGLVYRYGKAVNSRRMMQFAALLDQRAPGSYQYEGRDLFRTLENLVSRPALGTVAPALVHQEATWYPRTQFAYMQDDSGFFFASKGGHNNESHNHNDIGTFILYNRQTPVFIDAGVGTYTRQTFSKDRYKIWTMQSNYHNVPVINGFPQKQGAEFRAEAVHFDRGQRCFSLDISGAYPPETGVKTWKRTYRLAPGKLVIADTFALEKADIPNQLNFLVSAGPETTVPGIVVLERDGVRTKLLYDPEQFVVHTENIPIDDPRLSGVWGAQLYRLTLEARNREKSGTYEIVIENAG